MDRGATLWGGGGAAESAAMPAAMSMSMSSVAAAEAAECTFTPRIDRRSQAIDRHRRGATGLGR
eukprot:847572-Pleurochrysis_carterae.AAC.1